MSIIFQNNILQTLARPPQRNLLLSLGRFFLLLAFDFLLHSSQGTTLECAVKSWRGFRTRATFGQPQRGDFSRLNIGRRESSSANENLHHDYRMSGIRSQAIELSDKLQQP